MCWGGQGIPTEVPDLAGSLSIMANIAGVCGITAARAVRCTSSLDTRTTVDIAGVSNAMEIRGGGGFPVKVCVREQSNELKCFGQNSDPVTGARSWGAATSFATGIKAFEVGGDGGVCAALSDDRVFCSGENNHFQIENSATLNFPTPVEVQFARNLQTRMIRKSQNGTTCLLSNAGRVFWRLSSPRSILPS